MNFLLPDFVYADRLKELAEELCKQARTRQLDGQEMLDKIRQKLKVESEACASYVGPGFRRMEETLFSILYEWKRNTPTATIGQLAQHILDLGFLNVAYKLNPML